MLDDLQRRVNDLAQLIGLPVSLTTPALESIVFSPHSGAVIDAVRSKSLLSRDTDPWVVRWFQKAGVGTSLTPVFVPGIPEKEALPRWVIPVHTSGRIIAHLCILDPTGQCTEQALLALSDRAEDIGRIMLSAEATAQAAGSRLRAILTGDDAEQATVSLFGRDPRGPWRIAVAATIKEQPASTTRRRAGPARSGPFLSAPGVIESRFEDHHAFLLPAAVTATEQVFMDLAPCCPRPLIGLGAAADEPSALRRSYDQARGSLRFASAAAAAIPITDWENLGPIKVFSLQGPEVLSDAVDTKIAALSPTETDLLETVTHYLAHGRKPDIVADSLHIHRGTLYYRLRKFEDTTGLSLESGKDRLTIQLSLEALRLLNAPSWSHARS